MTNPAIAQAGSRAEVRATRRRAPRRVPRAALLLAPSFLIVAVFVYVFIAYTVGVALSRNWKPARPDFATTKPVDANFDALLNNGRFQADIRNAVVFTVF